MSDHLAVISLCGDGAVLMAAILYLLATAPGFHHHPVAPPPTPAPPQDGGPAMPLSDATNDTAADTTTQWALKEQAVLDECSGWMAGTRSTWTVGVPRSSRVMGGFTSQHKQDKLVWRALFNSTTSNRAADGRIRVYAEVAANHYKSISNSYFFDRCLHWRGLCVEPNPIYHANLLSERSCTLTPTCVANHTNEIEMRLPSNEWHGARGGATSRQIVHGHHVDSTKPVWKRCVRLQDEFDRLGYPHIDMLFLDLEGYEDSALRGIDFATTRIDYVMCESACDAMLTAHGYTKLRIPGWASVDQVWRRPRA